MIDEDFITMAYSTMERGFSQFKKRKKKLALHSVVKNFLFIFFIKPEKCSEKIFLLHPKPEVERIFKNATKLDVTHSSYLKKAVFYLQLGYISPVISIRMWAARKAYRYLQNYFRSSDIKIFNCGPSILSPFLAKLCEDKNDNSLYFIIQHGLYQSDYRPYEFELILKASRSIIWSDLLAQGYISLGMSPKKIHILPTYLFKEIKPLNNSRKVLIIGESLNKIDKGFDTEYQKKLLIVINYLKSNSSYNHFTFKKHPRARKSLQLHAALEKKSVIISDNIDLENYGLVIGAVSTLMIEALANGCRILQINLKGSHKVNFDNYSLYTSAENLSDMNEMEEKILSLNNLQCNHINSEFLKMEYNFADYYYQLIV